MKIGCIKLPPKSNKTIVEHRYDVKKQHSKCSFRIYKYYSYKWFLYQNIYIKKSRSRIKDRTTSIRYFAVS